MLIDPRTGRPAPAPILTLEELGQQNQTPAPAVDDNRQTFYDFALLVDLLRVAGSFFGR